MSDATPTSRVLRLLSLLQSRRYWRGPELAERVGASERTIRRDIERLRELGYRVVAERGAAGGYLLEAGSDLPPLLFTGDEAVALALGLRAAAADGAVRGFDDLTVAVLAKLEQVLPAATRARVLALQAAVAPGGPVRDLALVDPEVLAMLALLCRDSEIVRFRYSSGAGAETRRRVEPSALVPIAHRWYLLGWDLDRGDWRTFRVDRIEEPQPTHARGSGRQPPTDAATFVAERLGGRAAASFGAVIRIAAAFEEVEAYLGPFTSGLAADGPDHTLWRIRDDRIEILAGALAWLIWPFEIIEGDDLRDFAERFAGRLSGS